jgi:hypothetical protein
MPSDAVTNVRKEWKVVIRPAAGDRPVEILTLLGEQGERIHVRAAPRRQGSS